MNKKLMPQLVCPVCKGKLEYVKHQDAMICHHDDLAYPVRAGIPVLLESDAKKIEPSKTIRTDIS